MPFESVSWGQYDKRNYRAKLIPPVFVLFSVVKTRMQQGGDLYRNSLDRLVSTVLVARESLRARRNDPGFVKVSQNSILRISINIHCTAGELYS